MMMMMMMQGIICSEGLCLFFICLLHWCVFFYKYVVLYTPGRMFLL